MSDKKLVTDLNALITQATSKVALQAAKTKGALPGTTAVARPGRVNVGGGTGGGIASPLTETSAATREYWPDRVITSSDGVFTFVVLDLKTWNLKDANNADVVIKPANPA